MIDLNALITDLDAIGNFCVVNTSILQNNKYHLDVIYDNVTATDKTTIDNIIRTYMGNVEINSALESSTYKSTSIQI